MIFWGSEYPLLAALSLLPEKPRLLSCGPSIRTPKGLTQFLLTAHSHTTPRGLSYALITIYVEVLSLNTSVAFYLEIVFTEIMKLN